MKLANKVALATGTDNPCVKAILAGFARAGADCMIVDDDASAAEHWAAELRTIGRKAESRSCVVTNRSEVEAAVAATVARFGRIDILLNGSAETAAYDFLNVSAVEFNAAIDRGPKAYFLFCQAVGRVMAQQRSGKIINLATMDARIGSGESVCTSSAHASIDAMTRAVAQALGYYGVNANALLCGPVATPQLSSEEIAERLRRMPFGRLANPADFVGAAIFLASDDAGFITGESLCIDAGYANAAVTEDGFRPAWAKVWSEFSIPPAQK